MSGILSSVESLHGHYMSSDILESHFNLVSDGVLVLNINQTITKANRAALRIMGYRSLDQAVGKQITEVITSPLNNHLYLVFKEMIESKTS